MKVFACICLIIFIISIYGFAIYTNCKISDTKSQLAKAEMVFELTGKKPNIVDSWGTLITCSKVEKGWLCQSAGQDKKFNTGDDVIVVFPPNGPLTIAN